MTTILPRSAHEQQDAPVCASRSSLPDLSTLSTLWVPLHEVRQAWAAFGKEVLTTSALMATSTAFSGLYWETHALQHSTWAADERERGRWHRVVFWLSRAVQDLDCALDQWQQTLGWLDLAGNDHRQQDPESLELVRTLMAQVQWHQGRRRALHQQVLSEYSAARQRAQDWPSGFGTRGGITMATTKEQIAHYTSAEPTQQHVADDPLAPVPIRFTHQRDADGVIRQRIVNGPTAGWHLEDDAEASDAESSSSRPRGQGYTPSWQTRDYRQQAQVTQAYPPDYEDADTTYTAQARTPRSAMRYQDTLPHQYRGQVVLPAPPQHLRRQRLTGNAPGQPQHPSPRRSRLWSLSLVTGMLAMAALVAGLHSLGSWLQGVQDHWTYGYPRTFQTTAVVGHNHDSSSHPSQFVALNLHGQVEVLELPAGDPTRVRVFLGPTISGEGADRVVVTISYADIDHDGTPDLILHYGDSAEVLYNKGGTFQLSGGKA